MPKSEPPMMVEGILFTYRRRDGRLVDVFVPDAIASQARSAAGPIRGPATGYMQIHELEIVVFDELAPLSPDELEELVTEEETA